MSLTYKVVISDEALSDLRRYVGYLIYVKKNPQAASNILDDYDEKGKFLDDKIKDEGIEQASIEKAKREHKELEIDDTFNFLKEE